MKIALGAGICRMAFSVSISKWKIGWDRPPDPPFKQQQGPDDGGAGASSGPCMENLT
jgi:hypothetical protein